MSTGWLGQLGLIVAQGSNLFETMMLNLTLLQNGETLWNTQRPCWELEEVRSKERTEIALPDNAAELLTLQSRRLLLHRKEEKVIGYALLGGDFFNKENAFCEQMTVWRASQDKKSDPLVYRPRKHDSSKQFWQEFPAVFAPDEGQRMPGVEMCIRDSCVRI